MPEKYGGSARKMNSRTNMIKLDETRKLDYIDCGKSLKNCSLWNIFSYFLFIVFKMLFFIFHFWPLPEKLLDCPKKIILPDSGVCSPPAHTPMCSMQLKPEMTCIDVIVYSRTRRAKVVTCWYVTLQSCHCSVRYMKDSQCSAAASP